jgi:hypothetical protein
MLRSIKIASKPFEYDEGFSKPKQLDHFKRNLVPLNN